MLVPPPHRGAPGHRAVDTGEERRPQRGFGRPGERRVGVAALAGQHRPAAYPRRHQRGGAEPGARAHDRAHPARGAQGAAHLHQVIGPEMGDGQGHRLEIVDHRDVRDAERGAQSGAVENPGAIGEPERARPDVPGPGDDRAEEVRLPRCPCLGQKALQRDVQRRGVGGVHDPDRLRPQLALGHQPEPGGGAADVRRQQICHGARLVFAFRRTERRFKSFGCSTPARQADRDTIHEYIDSARLRMADESQRARPACLAARQYE